MRRRTESGCSTRSTAPSNNARFESARQLILDAPPGERAEFTRVLFQRLTEMSGNTWNSRSNPTAGGGVHFTGEGAPFIFAVDGAGNVYQGKIGPNTLIFHPDGTVGADYSTLRPLTGPPAPPPPPAPPAPTPPPSKPPIPAPSPRLPLSPHEREPEPVP